MTRRQRAKRLPEAQWYSIRPVRSLKPATYTCPLCGHRLHAMSDHVLVAPEGDTSRRRHAHLECVAAANLPGRPGQPGLLSRLLGRG
ncbi:MAG TPA: hypothetical protein VGK62_00460 [Gaiellaceae bacterium]